MKFRTVPVIAAAVVALVAPTAAAAAPAASGQTGAGAVAAADKNKVTVDVEKSSGVPGVRIAAALSRIYETDRAKVTQRAVKVAANADGGPYNVIIMNLSIDYNSLGLKGIRFYGNLRWNNIFYGLWIVERGTFKNFGDGGYINWAFIGQYKRNGNTINFH